MSQQLIPVDGGVQTLVTTPNVNRLNVLSEQYIKVNKLENRPTEWVPGGRPIYKRLPSASQTYQINFDEDNTQGYVYIPWGEGLYGPTSLEVVSSDSKEDLIVKSGNLVWAYGTNPVPPTLINLRELEIGSGRYMVAYRLVFDDAPVSNVYYVENFSLSGLDLLVFSSTDSITGWRYPVVNSFLDSTTKVWSNYDSYFPEFAQPTESFIQWQSNYELDGVYQSQAFWKVLLRCPPNTAFSGTATLSFVNGSNVSVLLTTSILRDSVGQYFEFNAPENFLNEDNNACRVDFSDLKMSIQSIRVTGNLRKGTPQSGPATQSALVIYPENAIPATFTNSAGVQVPMAYAFLALVDVGNDYTLQNIQDVRKVVHRDYTPVANWLTVPFDEKLINLYEQVSDYSELWMNPGKCMKQEYAALTQYDVTLT
jgi:hypothetical protein